MNKYEARIYIGKELYEDLFSLVSCGMFKSVNQALGEIVKSQEFREYMKNASKLARQVKEMSTNGE